MMSNDLLPNNSFLYKMKKAESPQCTFCDKFDGRLHFLACPYSGGVGEAVLNILVEATENKLNIQQLKVIELDTAQHFALPALFIFCEAGQVLMEHRKKGKSVVKKAPPHPLNLGLPLPPHPSLNQHPGLQCHDYASESEQIHLLSVIRPVSNMK